GMGRFRTQLQRRNLSRQSDSAEVTTVRLPAAGGVSTRCALPRLDARVPLEVIPQRLASANATLARFLLDAKAVRERDIPATWNDELLVCESALDAWIKREIGALHCLAPRSCCDRCGVRRAIRAARRHN